MKETAANPSAASTPAPRRVLYVWEAAKYLGLSEPQFHHRRKTDPLFPRPFAYDSGGDPKYDMRDLDAYVERAKARHSAASETERLAREESERAIDAAPTGIVAAVRKARAS